MPHSLAWQDYVIDKFEPLEAKAGRTAFPQPVCSCVSPAALIL
jgi:hypothetical protein